MVRRNRSSIVAIGQVQKIFTEYFPTNMEATTTDFKKFLLTAFDNGEYATDDVIAFVVPLFEEVLSFHDDGLVAPFEKQETVFITGNRLDIDENHAHKPSSSLDKIKELFKDYHSIGFVVTDETKVVTDIDEGLQQHINLNIHKDVQQPLKNPAYLLGYKCYEELIGHHDAPTDIFCLGLILGSMALSLDLYDEDDLETFVNYRTNPVYYNHRIHPTVSSLITEMTELDRNKRCPDLLDAINRLQHYRDFDPEKQTDLSNVSGWVNKEISTRSQYILNKLRNRLFDTSRRNRLLYYKGNNRFVNLTVSSVPMVLHYQSINPDMLFTWNKEISSKVKGMKEIALNKYLRFEDHQYVASLLDRIKTEAKHDKDEFGFSQLKLVVCFLNWHNLKEDKNERIQSPLLLIPVNINKRKALKEDQYTLEITDNQAEVNPVLSNYLRELYGIKLPDFIDLDEMTLPQFYDLLKQQIDSVNQGIQLNYIDKPRIKLIHSVAKQTVNTYRKRLRKTGRQLDSYKNIEYSYKPENYRPLGLEIFRQRVEQKPSMLEFLVNDEIKLSQNNLTGSNDKERKLFELQESDSNPYSWDVDTCNMVVGNFNYKKMSLVRDYTNIVDEKIEHDVFEQLFSDQPKPVNNATYNLNNPAEWYHVVTADPTQTKAILQSRTKESYIIQGPPGTGKSQTITNLIADFIAQGKNVLFVCEKRAALDVVYHRLKQNQLDELCCYIHDSQGDKREFIKNLKGTYEDFVGKKMDLLGITIHRNNSLQKLQEQLQMLEQFHTTNNNINDKAGIRVRALIDKLITLKPYTVSLSAQQQELLPHYDSWQNFGNTLQQLSKALEEAGAGPAFAEHPLSKLNDAIFLQDNPINLLQNVLQTAQRLLSDIEGGFKENNIPAEHASNLSSIKNLMQDAVLLEPLASSNNLHLVNLNNKESKAFEKEIKQYRSFQKQYETTVSKNSNWKNKFSEQDTINALTIAAKNEKSFFSFFNGTWRKLKKQLLQSYNFSQHQVKPSFSSVLQQLQQEHEISKQVAEQKQVFYNSYGIENIETTYIGIEKLRSKQGDKEVDFLLAHPNANQLVSHLFKLNNSLHLLEVQLQKGIANFAEKEVQQLKDEMESISMNLDSLQDLLPSLQSFAQLPETLKNAVRQISLTPQQAEACMAFKTWQFLLQSSKSFSATDSLSIENAVGIIQKEYKKLLQLNAQLIRANIRKKFAQNIELSMMAPSQLNAQQKEFKKKYNEGRKILEHEFSKSMRYKSIRELSAKESGLVLKDIKPVWLMSPLSVSDSLPVDVNYFDVVIFDEASQITLEEGIPALYRAKQSIIVGDEMQMPPTNFFTAKAEDPDDLEAYGNNDDDEILSTDADSLLIQGARKLSSVMLGWHYRSRYETLISYSNHAFYNKDLLTIPDKTIHHNSKSDIVVDKPNDGSKNVAELLSRSISYHYLPNSVYEKRSNLDEANYIAHLVRELLVQKTGNSIGIVAFSQEQQHQIEDALTILAASDKLFEELLETEYNRTEEEQFVGLIVKNLENIQGDERDIIIMSVCYGFDERKKMLMNFGPINKKGGEKRLNVIFSRAKKHMAIISSIKHHNITNEYNEGANYFKRFLHYAEMVSTGNMATARIILDGLVTNKSEEKQAAASSYMLLQMQKELQAKGYDTHISVGQSTFKCSLAIKMNKDDEVYTLGVVIDDDSHYKNENWLEQFFQRPAILQSFGWKVIAIFAKDWLQQPQKILEQIVKRLHEEPATEKNELPTIEMVDLQEAENKTVQPLINEPLETSTIELIFIKLASTENGSNKFWDAACDGNKMVVRFGKTGTKGQTQIKTFADYEAAEKERQKMITEKLAKGYHKI